jgi:hypothetical protein
MHLNPTYLLAWATRWLSSFLASALLTMVPNKFWSVVLEYIDVPNEIKELVNPLLGATCSLLAGEVYEYYKRIKNPAAIPLDTPNWIFAAKIFVGWIVGLNSISLIQPFLTASGPKIAFWAGAVGFGLIGGLVELIIKLILKQAETPTQP